MKIYDWKKFLTFIAVVLFIIIACLYITNKKAPEIERIEEYQIQSGETIWSICNKFRPKGMSIEEYIFNVRELNNEQDCIIYPSDTLQIPIYKEV